MGRYDKYKKLIIGANLVKNTITTSIPGYYGSVTVGGPGNEGIEMVTWINERIEDGSIEVSPSSGNTNLSYIRNSTTVTVESDTGNDAILPVATTSLAGVMGASDKVNLNSLITLSGVSANATHLGTFTGSIIPDNSTIKAAIQSLETAIGSGGLPAGSNGDILLYTGGNWSSVSFVHEHLNVTGSNITLASTPIANTLFLMFKNGIYLRPTDDYTKTGASITMASALTTNDNITAIYLI